MLAHTAVTQVPSPSKWLFVLHGIYGRGRNWTSVAKRFVAMRPEWGVALVDLRHHGDSPNPTGTQSLDACAEDVRHTVVGWPGQVAAIAGHSFGGKVALLASERVSVESVWLMDSTPQARPPSGAAWELLDIVDGLPQEFGSRAQLVEALGARGVAEGIATWMATNLVATGSTYRWRLDFVVMRALLIDFFARDLWRLVEDPPSSAMLHVVKAEDSSTMDADACERVERAHARHGRVALHRIAGGHWVNTDNPAAVVELWRAHLP